MTVYRSIRVQMPDRPGALSAVSAALAAHGVDIVRLDVVSTNGGTVVDDLLLGASSLAAIGNACGSFPGDTIVRTFDETAGDPALEMGFGVHRVATAPTVQAARDAAIESARHLLRGDAAVLLRATEGGCMSVVSGPAGLAAVTPADPFAPRWVLQHATAAAFPAHEQWAPTGFHEALGAAWVAVAPSWPLDLLLVVRRLNIAFHPGELERLTAFASAAGAILALRGDRPPVASIPAEFVDVLPPRAVTLGQRFALATA